MTTPSFQKLATQKITQRLKVLDDLHERDCVSHAEWFAGSYELERLMAELAAAKAKGKGAS